MMRRDAPLERRVADLYDSALPYHNFSHVQDALSAGGEILAQCDKERVAVDADIVYYALLFHDAGYRQDHRARGYASKEELAAALARAKLMEWTDAPEAVVAEVGNAIVATRRDVAPATPEQQVVRGADLWGMAADYATFRAQSERLWSEQRMLTGLERSWSDWVREAADVIEEYVARPLDVIAFFRSDGREMSSFQSRARANIRRLLAEG